MELCVQCEKKEITKRCKSKLCHNCLTKQWTKLNPEKYKLIRERSRKKQNQKRREEVRRNLNLPLDYPPLIAIKGNGYINNNGYRLICSTKYKCHPNGYKGGQILEHVVVMTEILGRPLIKGETIHHKNGIRDDNRSANLELWVSSHPPGQRPEDMIEWGKSFFPNYGHQLVPIEQVEMRYE